ncbi:MAG: polysaccharide lyase, partial [Nanoarchaeota archaeon]
MNKTTYLKRVNFKDHKLGLYDLQTFSKDWNNPKWNRGITEKRCRIVKVNGENVLEITIPKNTVSNGGSFWRLELSPSLKDVTLEYDIMFGNNFNFVRGGKLPGLGGGSCPGGGSKDKEGFSARLMW